MAAQHGRMFASGAMSPIQVAFPPEGVFVLESRHGKGFRMETAAHDFWKALLVFRGSGRIAQGSHYRPVAAGDVIVVPPGTPHRIEDSGGAPLSLYGVCLQTAFLQRLPGPVGLSGSLQVYRRPVWAAEIAGLVRSMLIEQSCRAPGSAAWLAGLAWQIVGLLWRAHMGGNASAHEDSGATSVARERVACYARELPRNFHKETSIDEAAGRLGLSRRRFTQLFREISGQSWLQTLRRLRIEHARRLLRQTSRSVAAVAFEAGFSDLSHFYRVFRHFSGSSPEAWRHRATRPAPGTEPAGRSRFHQ